MASAAVENVPQTSAWRVAALASILVLAVSLGLVHAAGLSSWKPLPAQPIETRRIDNVLWTEGMSATSAGRFANSTFNGLLTETVYQNWFYTGEPRQWFDWVVPGADDEPVAEKVQTDWTHQVWDRVYAGGRRLAYISSVLAPGFLMRTNAPRLTLQAREGAKAVAIWETELIQEMTMAGRAPLALLIPGRGGQIEVIKDAKWWEPVNLPRPAEPWAVVLYPRVDAAEYDDNLYFWGDKAVGVLLTFERPVSLRWWAGGLKIGARGELGTIGVSTAFDGLLKDVAGKNWRPDAVAKRARQLTRLLHTYPVKCREWYARDAGWMRIRNEFSYRRWGDPKWQAADYAPVPPLYVWSEKALGWPAFPKATDSGILTRFGPYRTYPGSVARYRLPMWTNEYASFPRTDERPEVRDAEAAAIKTFAEGLAKSPPTVNAWGPVWTPGIAAPLGAYNLLDDEAKRGLIAVADDIVRRSWAQSNWHLRRDTCTGLQYYGGGWGSENPNNLSAVDENSALGSALYGTYVYAKFSGDWGLIRDLMPRMWDAERQFELFNDWAAPQTSCRSDVRYSGIDMDTIALAGIFGLQRMSEIAGSVAQAERAAYLQAKIAPVTLLRFTLPRYLDPDNREPKLITTGLEEDGPERSLLVDDAVVKDHLAMLFSWCGQQAEIYRYYLAGAGAGFFRTWERDFYARPEINWYEPRVNPGRLYSHVAMRAWCDFCGAWPEQSELTADFDNALAKSGYGSEAGEAIALFLGRKAPAYLVRWEPARLLGAEYDAQKNLLHVRIEATQSGALVLRAKSAPRTAEVNGGPAAFESVGETLPVPRPELGKLVSIPTPSGKLEIVVGW